MNRRMPGYSLLEMLAALSLIGVFAIFAGRLMLQSQAIQRDAAAVEWAVSRTDFALRQLRADVWEASSLLLGDETTLSIIHAHGQSIRWSFTPDASSRWPQRGWLTRTIDGSSGESQRYEVPFAIEYGSIQEHGLQVRVDRRPLWLTRASGWLSTARETR